MIPARVEPCLATLRNTSPGRPSAYSPTVTKPLQSATRNSKVFEVRLRSSLVRVGTFFSTTRSTIFSTIFSTSTICGCPPTAEATQIVERVVERIIQEPYRQKLAKTRPAQNFEFRVADCKGFVTVGEYEDGRPGEIFITVSKQGSTLAGIMDAFAISISHGLQYGVPLRSFVETFTGMRFEPAGMTDDPDIRFATSLMDYLFRKLAILYLSPEERNELGIHTVSERTQPTLPGVEETVTQTVQGQDVTPDPPSIESASTLSLDLDLTEARAKAQSPTPVADVNAPLCMQCGIQMQRAGSCHACPSCGTTSGCS